MAKDGPLSGTKREIQLDGVAIDASRRAKEAQAKLDETAQVFRILDVDGDGKVSLSDVKVAISASDIPDSVLGSTATEFLRTRDSMLSLTDFRDFVDLLCKFISDSSFGEKVRARETSLTSVHTEAGDFMTRIVVRRKTEDSGMKVHS